MSLGCVILLFGNLKLIENSCSNFLSSHPTLQNMLGAVFTALGLGFKAGEFAWEST